MIREPVLADVVLAVQRTLLAEHGGLPGIRDKNLLDSALNRPPQRFVYEADVSIYALAVSYAYGLSRNFPFVDGNKRIALSVAAIFLRVNGYSLNAPETETVVIFQQLASGQFSEDRLTDWFRANIILQA